MIPLLGVSPPPIVAAPFRGVMLLLIRELYKIEYFMKIFCIETHWKFFPFLFTDMGCHTCGRESEDTSHDFCRAHSFCNDGGGARYFADPCYICQELFDRAADMSNLEDSKTAFLQLSGWIQGFRKNSRNREPGQDHFVDPQERAAYQQLYALHSRRRSRDPSAPSAAVGVSYCFAFT